jgi:hypothetical protein
LITNAECTRTGQYCTNLPSICNGRAIKQYNAAQLQYQ